jgi:hypothetical protein
MDAVTGGEADKLETVNEGQRKRPAIIADDSELAFWARDVLRLRDEIERAQKRHAWARERVFALMGDQELVRIDGLIIEVKQATISAFTVAGNQHLRLEVTDLTK